MRALLQDLRYGMRLMTKKPGFSTVIILTLALGIGANTTMIGVAAAFGLTRFIEKMLFGVSPADPLTFIAVTAVLVLAALVASLVPARRATKVDPLIALRYE